MAASNFFQAQKALFISLTFFLLLLSRVSLAKEEIVRFSFPRFVPDHRRNFTFQGDAVLSTDIRGQLRLTRLVNGVPAKSSRGRALYSDPIHIWDRRSGNVASFATSFSFIITAPRSSGATADGLAFFLAPVNTQPRRNGGFLGLFENDAYNKNNQIVAVEFDTWPNTWDPRRTNQHIGIDVNSIRSTKTTQWNFRDNWVADVDISYEASSKILNATLHYGPIAGRSITVTDVVDLKDILPDRVRVGFSASTGNEAGIHDIISWDFYSKLPISTNTKAFMNEAHLSSFVQRI